MRLNTERAAELEAEGIKVIEGVETYTVRAPSLDLLVQKKDAPGDLRARLDRVASLFEA